MDIFISITFYEPQKYVNLHKHIIMKQIPQIFRSSNTIYRSIHVYDTWLYFKIELPQTQ